MYIVEGNIYVSTNNIEGNVVELQARARTEKEANKLIKKFKTILKDCNDVWKGKMSLGSRFINDGFETTGRVKGSTVVADTNF